GLTPAHDLDLSFLISTKTDAALRGRDEKAHDIAPLGHEVRIGRELERLHPMRREPEGPPDALHRRYRQAAGLRHAAGTPMGSVLGAALQFPYDHSFDAGIVDRARRSGARLVLQPRH